MKIELDQLRRTMELAQKSRDTILTESRTIITLCSRSIIQIHNGDMTQAASLLERAKSIHVSLQDKILDRTAHYMMVAEQEYVEASCLLHIVQNNTIPDIETLGVMPESYILGLLDVIGELKRVMLDRMREGRIQQATDTFEIMDALYCELYPFMAYDKVLKDARRKMDVCRIIMEHTRMTITEESRRQDMMRAMGFEPTNSFETSPSS